MSDLKVGDIVTYDFNSKSSNTFYIARKFDKVIQLSHPLTDNNLFSILVEVKENELNKVQSNLKCSTERQLVFAKNNIEGLLGIDHKQDLQALSVCFALFRRLTPRQKNILSGICGSIANIKLNQDIKDAMELISKNEGILDDFNKMWYKKFNNIFTGKSEITSKKQRSAIFNIAGFVLAELETPVAYK